MTFGNMKSYLKSVYDKKIPIGHVTLETKVVMW